MKPPKRGTKRPAKDTPVLLEGEEPEQQEEELSQSDADAFEEIARIQEELGQEEGRVVLRRRNDKGQMANVGTMAAVDFSIDRVIADYGGGRYEAVFFKGKERLGSTAFLVDETIPRRLPRVLVDGGPKEEKTNGASAGAPAGHHLSLEEARIVGLERILDRQADLLNQLVVNMVTRPHGNGGQQQPMPQAGLDVKDVMALAVQIVEAINARMPQVQDKPSIAEMKDLFTAGIEAARAAEGGDSYWPVLDKFAGPVARVLDAALQRERSGAVAVPGGVLPSRAVPPVNPPTAASPATPPANGAPASALPPTAPSWVFHVQPYLSQILAWARAGKDPALYAEVILDNLNEAALVELRAAVQDPGFVDKALAVLPMFQPHSAWATQVLTNIRDLVLAPEEPEGGDGDGASDGG